MIPAALKLQLIYYIHSASEIEYTEGTKTHFDNIISKKARSINDRTMEAIRLIQ